MYVRIKYLALLLTVILLLAGCDQIDRIDFGGLIGSDSGDDFVCERPYRRHMDSCCLDQDWNKICDSDEAGPTEPVDTPDEPDTPDVPDTPDEPDTPDVPDTPDEPDTPDVPDTPDNPCAGVSCLSTCDANTRKYDGACVDGVCQYQTEVCEFGCVGGLCTADSCDDITCDPICDGDTRKYDGACTDGACIYQSELCVFGCTGGVCDPDPCIGISCSDTCDADTRKYGGACADGACVYDTEVCVFGCTGGVCDADPCEGVTCSNICDGTTRKYNGACADGACVYGTEVCQQGCDSGVCNEGFTIFTGSQYKNGDFGGIAVANTDCQNMASAAGLTGQFKAWLSDSTVNAKDRITVTNKPYYLLNGVKVANNLADMLDGSLLSKIYIRETGEDAFGARVWTGTTSAGLKASTNPLDFCDDWTDQTKSSITGKASYSSSEWTDYTDLWGVNWGTFYCFQDEWTEYYCQWTWPQKVTYKASGSVYTSCTSARPYCNKDTGPDGRPQCCEYTEEIGYFNCVGV